MMKKKAGMPIDKKACYYITLAESHGNVLSIIIKEAVSKGNF